MTVLTSIVVYVYCGGGGWIDPYYKLYGSTKKFSAVIIYCSCKNYRYKYCIKYLPHNHTVVK